jgi:hypothetical protein
MEDQGFEYHYAVVNIVPGEEFAMGQMTYRLALPEGFHLMQVIGVSTFDRTAEVVLVK